jgi:hypothetical protein
VSHANPEQGSNTAPASEQSLARQVRLLQWGIAAGLILILAAGGVGLYYEIGLLNRKVSALQRSLGRQTSRA